MPYLPRIGSNVSAKELANEPTLAVGQESDLKIDEDGFRVWLSRSGRADYDGNLPNDFPLSYERLINGRWESCDRNGVSL